MHFNAGWGDNALPILKQASTIMAWLHQHAAKSEAQIERGKTVMERANGAVAGRGANDDDEISSGNVSSAGGALRSRK